MSKQSWYLFSLMIIGLPGAPGCGRPGPGTGGTPQATSTKIESERKADQNAGIPVEQLGPVLEAHYQGVGFMERFQYHEAVPAFREVHRRAPLWIPASINLAIALMYGGGPMPEVGGRATDEEALDLLDGVIARDPTNLHAHYCRGVVLERLGLWGRAHAEFQTVIDKDPNDAHAWYMLGSTVRVPEPNDSVRRGDLEKSREKPNDQAALLRQIACWQRSLQCNPYLMTVRYRLAMAYRKARDLDEVRKQLGLWQKLDGVGNGNRPGEEFRPTSTGRWDGMRN